MTISLTDLETSDDLEMLRTAKPVLIEVARATVALEAAKRTAAKTRARLTDERAANEEVYQAIERDDRTLFKCIDDYRAALTKVRL
jgi:hypothetical protein